MMFAFGFTVAHAQSPKIRAHLEAPDPLWTGEKVTLVVELLVPGYFSSAPGFELPDPAGLILLPPTEHPVVSGETIDGTYYVTQRHELAVYPARAGERVIPPFPVRLAFKRSPLDHDDVAAVVTTPALTLKVTTPPGTAGLGQVISARDLQVGEEWKPEPGKTPAKVGDAFTRTITFSAPEVPGMVFPPFPALSIAGLRQYPKPPALLDHTERGELRGGRRDTVVYVCERPGEFTLPAARLTWWDLEAKQVRTADLPARTFTVAANPALATARPAPAPPSRGWGGSWWWLGGGVALVALLGFGGRRLVAPFRPVHLQPLNPGAGPAGWGGS